MAEAGRQTQTGEIEPDALLREGSVQLGLALSEAQFDSLMTYAHALLKWRRVYNLIGAKSLHEVVTHHLLDSLSVAGAIEGRRLLDIGSGAGLPGLPLAVALPDISVVLLEANAKRTHFLKHAVQILQLRNVEVVRERAENYNQPQGFECIVSRALCGWAQFAALAVPHLSETGQLLAMKGRFDEQPGPDESGVEIVAVDALSVPGVSAKRCLVRGARRA